MWRRVGVRGSLSLGFLLSGLTAGNTVSLRGLLFKTNGDPILLADTVRLR